MGETESVLLRADLRRALLSYESTQRSPLDESNGTFDGFGTKADRGSCSIEDPALRYLASRFESLKGMCFWQIRRYLSKDG